MSGTFVCSRAGARAAVASLPSFPASRPPGPRGRGAIFACLPSGARCLPSLCGHKQLPAPTAFPDTRDDLLDARGARHGQNKNVYLLAHSRLGGRSKTVKGVVKGPAEVGWCASLLVPCKLRNECMGQLAIWYPVEPSAQTRGGMRALHFCTTNFISLPNDTDRGENRLMIGIPSCTSFVFRPSLPNCQP